MKDITDESVYLIDGTTASIPNLGLGDFVKGYSDKDTPFLWKFLLWLLFPVVGWCLVLIVLIVYIIRKMLKRSHTVLIYTNGIYIYTSHVKSHKKMKELIVNFDDVIGISCEKTMQYTNSFYTGTSYTISWLDSNMQDNKMYTGSYQNETEEAGCYNFSGYVAIAIMQAWNKIALEWHIRELQQKQYTSFYYKVPSILKRSELKMVQLSSNLIKTDENYIDNREFKYKIEDGCLFIYPSKSSRQKSFKIFVNSMYDSKIFFFLLNEYWGIG